MNSNPLFQGKSNLKRTHNSRRWKRCIELSDKSLSTSYLTSAGELCSSVNEKLIRSNWKKTLKEETLKKKKFTLVQLSIVDQGSLKSRIRQFLKRKTALLQTFTSHWYCTVSQFLHIIKLTLIWSNRSRLFKLKRFRKKTKKVKERSSKKRMECSSLMSNIKSTKRWKRKSSNKINWIKYKNLNQPPKS